MGGVDDADEARFAALFDQHYEQVLRYARRRADDDAAEDVAAEVFLVAWRRLAAVPDPAVAWLIATARRVLANQRRAERRQDALRIRLRAERSEIDFSPRVETRDAWSTALASLSGPDQEVLALIAWDRLTVAQAAASLGCSRTAFSMRLGRARRRLAAALADSDRGADTRRSAANAHARRSEIQPTSPSPDRIAETP